METSVPEEVRTLQLSQQSFGEFYALHLNARCSPSVTLSLNCLLKTLQLYHLELILEYLGGKKVPKFVLQY